MKNIFKLLLASLLVTFLFVACDNDADRDWTTPDATFKLHDTSLGAKNVLYETMKNNPFVLTWDAKGTGEYSVVLSASENFENKTVLGTTAGTTFATTIGSLNEKLLQLGFSPFSEKTVYVRIETGSDVSNAITFSVQTYPVSGPIINTPTSGGNIALNSADQTATAITVAWSDYSEYGSEDVKYLVEVASKGSTSFVSLGEVTNTKSLAVSSKDLNTAALSAGAIVNVESELDFRVTAKTSFSTPSIELKSAVVTAKLTPYQVDYPDFFLVGGATAVGWSDTGAQKLYKKDNTSVIYTYLQEDANGFRFLGQQAWDPINYSLDDSSIKDNYRYFKTWSTNLSPESNEKENIVFNGTAGIYKVSINADFSVKSITVTPSAITTWDVPNLYLVGSVNGWDAATAAEFTALGNGKYEIFAELSNDAQFKFIGQQSWGDLDWGNISGDGNTGFIGPKGDNGNIKFDGGNQWYKITVDIKMGTYKIDPI